MRRVDHCCVAWEDLPPIGRWGDSAPARVGETRAGRLKELASEVIFPQSVSAAKPPHEQPSFRRHPAEDRERVGYKNLLRPLDVDFARDLVPAPGQRGALKPCR